MVYLENFKFLRRELKVLLYISLISIFLIEFVLFSVEEIFPKANSIGNVYLKICYSYISALIFYFLVVHYKRQDEKRKYYKVLKFKLDSLIREYHSIFNQICKINSVETFDFLNESKLKKYLKNIHPYSNYLGVRYINSGNIPWMNHLFNVAEHTRKEIEYLFLNSSLIEIDLINILNNLNNSLIFKQIRLFNETRIGNESFEDMHDWFSNYSKVIDELEKYIPKEIEKYNF